MANHVVHDQGIQSGVDAKGTVWELRRGLEMQTQMQVPGQVISQVALGPQQNGNAPNSIGLPSTWPRWQSEQDTSLRRHIVENM